MKCSVCNTENSEEALFCANCGNKLKNNDIENTNKETTLEQTSHETIQNNVGEKKEKVKKKIKFKIDILTIIIIILLIVLAFILKYIVFDLFNDSKDKILSAIEKDSNIKFIIGEDEFSIGDSFSKYKDFGYNALDEDDFIKYDSIAIDNIYKDGKAYMLASFYCPNKEGCSYKEANIIKANLYKYSNAKVNDITFGTKEKEVKEKLGDPTGVLKIDSSYYIWSNGKKVGDSYIMIKYSNGWSTKTVTDIKIGIWWFDGEYDATVKEGA